MEHQKILILDFGGPYAQITARAVRSQNVYCEVHPCSVPAEFVSRSECRGVILSGGVMTGYGGAPVCDEGIFDLGIPVLGLGRCACAVARKFGGKAAFSAAAEPVNAVVRLDVSSALFSGLDEKLIFGMDRSGVIEDVPDGFSITASTDNIRVAAIENAARNMYALRFHPELDAAHGKAVLWNFLYGVCGCCGDWTVKAFVERSTVELKEKIGGRRVLLALSGGVDSSVCAVLLNRAVGDALHCIFVDHGLLRLNEADEVEQVIKREFNISMTRVNASGRFLSRLAGVTEPEAKRKIVGEEFIRVFEEESTKLGKIDVLVQGTIYPDIIESGLDGNKAVKSHHNVGGLPETIGFSEIVEPLRLLFKDEVRQLGLELGMPESIVWRQPFPGPGLAVRVLGEISRERLDILREADAIFRQEIMDAGLVRDVNQYFAVMTDIRSVGVSEGGRTFEGTVALRAVNTSDFMTADWARLPFELLEKVSRRICGEVSGVSRVVYDITSKPPATIEWE